MSTSGLLSPITINTLVVRNRAVMPSMLTNFATKGGDVTERLIHYYAERAKGGVGLVSIEGTAVEPRGTAFIRGIGFFVVFVLLFNLHILVRIYPFYTTLHIQNHCILRIYN